MSAISKHHKNRPTVSPVKLTTEQIARTVYPQQLVWFTPPVTGGKVACRLISIDLEEKTCELEVTATGSNLYRRGSREFHVPFTRVFGRNSWNTPRFRDRKSVV